jgi:hypothetical protein
LSDRILPQDLDQSPRDFDEFRARIVRMLEVAHPDWTDTAIANWANLLMELFPYIGDNLHLYLSGLQGEAFFTIARLRESGVRHGRAVGYRFRRQTAATVDVTITLRGGPYAAIQVQAGKVVASPSATNPARVQILADHEIPAGSSSYSVSCEDSRSHPIAGSSTGLADQRVLLDQTPFLTVVELGDEVTPIGDPDPWTEVDNFFDSGPTDPHYRIESSGSDAAQIVFGDGNNGRIPSGEYTGTYKSGGGEASIDPGSLTVPEFTLQDAEGASVAFETSNPSAASGGLPRETLAEAQWTMPARMSINQRTVTGPDFKTNAERVAGVIKAAIVTSDQQAGVPENFGYLYILAQGSKLSSGAVRSTIVDGYPDGITFEFMVVDPPPLVVNVSARVRLVQGASATTVDAAIRSNLADYFAAVIPDETSTEPGALIPNPRFLYGFEMKDEDGNVRNILPWSHLFDVVQDTTGVSEVDKNTFAPVGNTTIPLNAWPQLGTVTLYNDKTGQELA